MMIQIKDVQTGVEKFLKQYEVEISSKLEQINNEATLVTLLSSSVVTELATEKAKPTPKKKTTRIKKEDAGDPSTITS